MQLHILSILALLCFLLSSCTESSKFLTHEDLTFNEHIPTTEEKKLKLKQIGVVSYKEAFAFIQSQTIQTKMLFAPQNIPYSGQQTKSTSCLSQVNISNEIQETANEVFILFDLTATERFIYGSCIPSQEIYKSQLLYLYCRKNSKLFEIKYFFDKSLQFPQKIVSCK